MTSVTQHPVPKAEQLHTVGAVAEHLALSRSKLYSLMDAGELPFVKFGKSRRIRWSDVLALIERSTIGGDATCNCPPLS